MAAQVSSLSIFSRTSSVLWHRLDVEVFATFRGSRSGDGVPVHAGHKQLSGSVGWGSYSEESTYVTMGKSRSSPQPQPHPGSPTAADSHTNGAALSHAAATILRLLARSPPLMSCALPLPSGEAQHRPQGDQGAAEEFACVPRHSW